MARISFRQGIVRHPANFLQINGDTVDLTSTTGNTVQVTFAHGPKDYFFTERSTITQAWQGPFTSGDHWLYWDIDKTSGVRTFGSTTLQPVVGNNAPSSPAPGQMWFDTNTKEMKEWSGSSWVIKIRVIAAKYSNSSNLESVANPGASISNEDSFAGTQATLTTPTRAGGIVYDLSGNPILDANKRFFTTEDDFITGVPSGAELRISNIVKTAEAQEPISQYQVVKLSGINQVSLATVSDQGSKVLGMVDNSASVGDLVDFTTEGIFTNTNWDWFSAGLSVNDGVYIDNVGTITDTPQSVEQLPVGVVLDAQTIMFAPRLFPNVLTDITNEPLGDLSDVNASTPSEDQALVYDGTEWVAQNPENWSGPVTTSTTLTGTGSNVIADTSGGAITITLPSSPSNGWSFKLADLTTSWGTNNLTIDADGSDVNTIEGSATSTQSTNDSMIEVIFLNGDWKIRTLV